MYNINSFKKARIIEMSPGFQLALDILAGRVEFDEVEQDNDLVDLETLDFVKE